MSPSSRRIVCPLFFSLLNLHGVAGADISINIGLDVASAGSSGSVLRVVFGLTITFGVITLFQLGYSLKLFRKVKLLALDYEPTQPHDVGSPFHVLLICYTTVYLLDNILYAFCLSQFGDNKFLLPDTFGTRSFIVPYYPLPIGTVFTGQFAIFLFYATLLSVIEYRQQVQLNLCGSRVNFKTSLDIWLLATILILAVGQAGVLGATSSSPDPGTVSDLTIVHEALAFLASLDVAISSFIAHTRLSQAGTPDKIINTSAFVVSPIVVAGGIFRIIYIGIENNAGQSFNFAGLLIAAVTVKGIVSIATIWYCLRMGIPTTLDK